MPSSDDIEMLSPIEENEEKELGPDEQQQEHSSDEQEDEEIDSDEEEELGPLKRKWPFDGEGRSRDVPLPVGATSKKINTILAQAEANAGEFTFGGVADTLPAVPGLVRKSWQLQPDRVQFKNPVWQTGMDKLAHTVAERLGYKSVSMECKLYKMLVYGEGGHFLKHQDTEKEDGMVATLVVQLPSTHEGGDLIIYRGGEVKHRHDFGTKDGTAAYLPHYAVHYADAEHALEKVTKGFRLALVYSLCLPLAMRHLERDHDKLMSEELADAIRTMGPEEESFALLLAHEYTEKSVGDLGSGALKGIDRARFMALEDANAAVDAVKKLQFYIAKMTHEIEYYSADGYERGDWEEGRRESVITWFSTSGHQFGAKKLTMKMNFLNLGFETFYELWRTHGTREEQGFMGNEGPSMNTTYSRYAVIAWSAAKGVENAFKFINAEAGEPKTCYRCEKAAVPIFVKMLDSLDWSDVGEACLESFGQLGDLKTVAAALQVADGLEDGTAPKNGLMELALENAVKRDRISYSVKYAIIFWKWVLHSSDSRAYDTLDAQNHAAKMMRANQEEDDNAFVTITKTRGWFASREKLVQQYKAELNILAKSFADAVASSPRKRARPGQ
ncbi:hypothetical protein PHYSODRAFT_253566 [Phytophthora sojae]|uniref:Fe2OG dioxygenase domain-containing protein n=1 Tax=Phytophthora sojae (strain P6497) TaxID=1094619 RepID=G4YUQ5_PHYSP|nr:hypothetical protein PHYSODRAFT_253566 [Phytophthora sojae]EGZ25980.1 hypothetical protein PHYSODRAFT_253566 [Phytophthora sojae]|eukprot:XP_009521268.1 hypothetical protein PHYSODRAFT_253566 [Phytophthora sojae]